MAWITWNLKGPRALSKDPKFGRLDSSIAHAHEAATDTLAMNLINGLVGETADGRERQIYSSPSPRIYHLGVL